ncbi:MAG TPA: DUF99 family protein [archaeon]|nr:DUF99 family protein [archaeon]
MLKPEIRILGFDDGAFVPRSKASVPVIGVIFRGGNFLDGALKTDVVIDGMDATEKIIKLINSTRHKQQLKVMMFDGITLGGFNIVDIKKIHQETGLPVIVVNRKRPNLKNVKNALKNFDDFKERWKIILSAGKIRACRVRNKNVYYQSVGLTHDETKEIIALSSTRSFIPEPLRIAHIIATAFVKGESSGRA